MRVSQLQQKLLQVPPPYQHTLPPCPICLLTEILARFLPIRYLLSRDLLWQRLSSLSVSGLARACGVVGWSMRGKLGVYGRAGACSGLRGSDMGQGMLGHV